MNETSVSTSLFNIESHVVTCNELFMSTLSSYRCGSKAYKRDGRRAVLVMGSVYIYRAFHNVLCDHKHL